MHIYTNIFIYAKSCISGGRPLFRKYSPTLGQQIITHGLTQLQDLIFDTISNNTHTFLSWKILKNAVCMEPSRFIQSSIAFKEKMPFLKEIVHDLFLGMYISFVWSPFFLIVSTCKTCVSGRNQSTILEVQQKKFHYTQVLYQTCLIDG